MYSGVRLLLVTDNPAKALNYMLECTEDDAPAWVRAITLPEQILAIPDGMKCQGLWFNGRKNSHQAMNAWRDRRRGGGLRPLKDADWDRIVQFSAKRRIAAGARLPEEPQAEPVDHRPPEQIKDLVLSQRWK